MSFDPHLALILIAAAIALLDPALYAAAACLYAIKARQDHNAATPPAKSTEPPLAHHHSPHRIGCYVGLAIVHVALAISKLCH